MKKYAFVILVAVVAVGVVLTLQGRSPKTERADLSHEGHDHAAETEAMAHPPVTSPQTAAEGMDFSGIDIPKGGRRIEALYAEKGSLAGKEVVVRGKVTKFTPGVMGKNWIHLMDGSGAEGTNDLTVTTDASVKVGDVIVVNGVMSTDRDFGMGYAYEILVENAKVTVE